MCTHTQNGEARTGPAEQKKLKDKVVKFADQAIEGKCILTHDMHVHVYHLLLSYLCSAKGW